MEDGKAGYIIEGMDYSIREDIIGMQKEIVVVTATDASYFLNCYVSVFSIIKTANPDNIYRIFVFTTGVSLKNKDKLEGLNSDYVFVKCIDVADTIKKFDLRGTEQFPISIYYRFFIPLTPVYNFWVK